MNVYARNLDSQPVQRLLPAHTPGIGGLDEVGDGLGDEGPGAAGGVEDGLLEGVRHHLPDHGSGQPVGGVVLAKLTAFVGRDHGLVEDGRHVVGGLLPVEAGDATGEGLDEGEAAFDLRGPGEEVRLHHALQAGLAAELPSVEQVCGVVLRPLSDVDAEAGLDHHPDDGGEIGVADEEVVHLRLGAGHLAEGGHEQVAPKLGLDADGVGMLVAQVEGLEDGDVAFVGGAPGAEAGGDGAAVGPDVILGGEGVVAEPFEEGNPPVGIVEGEGVGEGGLDGSGVGPAEEPVLAVREDAHADAALLVGLLQVVVELVHVVGVEAARRADATLELDEGVEGRQVHGATRAQGRGILLDDFIGSGQAG